MLDAGEKNRNMSRGAGGETSCTLLTWGPIPPRSWGLRGKSPYLGYDHHMRRYPSPFTSQYTRRLVRSTTHCARSLFYMLNTAFPVILYTLSPPRSILDTHYAFLDAPTAAIPVNPQ